MAEIITSSNNPTVRSLRKLASSNKVRREEGKTIASGTHLVRSFLESGSLPEICFIATAAQANDEVVALITQLQRTDTTLIELSDSVFESVADVHAEVGIAIVFTLPTHTPVNRIARDALMLEDIQDPGNLGTILRTAAAAGVTDIFLSPNCASVWSPKALRAGMGAQFGLTLHEQSNLEELTLSSQIPVYATTLAADNVDVYELDLTDPVAWIVGNEGQGVSRDLAAAANQRVRIPQAHTPVESLNVAAATAVCLYEQFRQRI